MTGNVKLRTIANLTFPAPFITERKTSLKTDSQPRLIAIGGAEDRIHQKYILKHVIEAIGGDKGHLVFLTPATGYPEHAKATYEAACKDLNCKNFSFIDFRSAEDADNLSLTQKDIIAKATGFFFTGGSQEKLVNTMDGTMADRLIRQRHLEGAVIIGTSAGAHMMADRMIVPAEKNDCYKVAKITKGMGFMSDIVGKSIGIESHLCEGRQRFIRTYGVIKDENNGVDLILLLPEDTGVICYADGTLEALAQPPVCEGFDAEGNIILRGGDSVALLTAEKPETPIFIEPGQIFKIGEEQSVLPHYTFH